MRVVLAAVILAFAASLPVQAQAAENDALVREILSEAVKLYRVGKYDEASATFKEAINRDLSNKTAFDFYLAITAEKLSSMMERDELEEVLMEIRRRAHIYQADYRRQPEYIQYMVEKLVGKSEEERLVAQEELAAIGPRAVPFLLGKMVDNREDEARIHARLTLARMGARAVNPLIAALDGSDEALLNSAMAALADIRSVHALPALKVIAQSDDHGSTVRTVAESAIAAIAEAHGISQVADAQTLYFQEASRYFQDGGEVRDEAAASDYMLWRWNSDAEKLEFVTAPSYAWNELRAEEVLFKAGSHFPENEAILPLLAAVLASQDVEANLRLRMSKEALFPPASPEGSSDALQQRVDALGHMRARVRMFGAANISRGVLYSIRSERFRTSAYLMDLLADPWLAHPDEILPSPEEGLVSSRPGTVLIAALDHPEKTVRYHAAVTLAKLDPAMEFFGSEKVMPILTEAVGEWGMRVVLVVEPDYRHRNRAREELINRGYIVLTASDGFEAMRRLSEAPVKDAVIVAGDLTPSVRDADGDLLDLPQQTAVGLASLLSDNARTQNTPVLVSLPEDAELAVKVRNAFQGKDVDFVKRPYVGAELKGKIDAATEDAELPALNRETREELSLAAGEAMASIDPVHTQYPLNSPTVVDALLATIENRADALRVQTLQALGHTGVRQAVVKVIDTYKAQDAQMADEVRVAFLYCIGLLDATSDDAIAILEAALQHDSLEVQQAAAQAIGRNLGIQPDTRMQFERQERLDARTQGANP